MPKRQKKEKHGHIRCAELRSDVTAALLLVRVDLEMTGCTLLLCGRTTLRLRVCTVRAGTVATIDRFLGGGGGGAASIQGPGGNGASVGMDATTGVFEVVAATAGGGAGAGGGGHYCNSTFDGRVGILGCRAGRGGGTRLSLQDTSPGAAGTGTALPGGSGWNELPAAITSQSGTQLYGGGSGSAPGRAFALLVEASDGRGGCRLGWGRGGQLVPMA
jgi:hypothetical protein